MKIIDSFIFYNELDLLNLRLHENNNVVDYFILVEANKTFANNNKPFYFEENKNKFDNFLHKIIHIKVDDMPNNTDNWEREWHQRNCIERGLVQIPDLNDTDIIFISDVDEIFRNSVLTKIKQDESYCKSNHIKNGHK